METIKQRETPQLQEDLNLQYLVREGSTASGKQKVLILLHGVGSNEQDLFSLAAFLPDTVTVISPRGPFILDTQRYAWYQVDFSTGKPEINAPQELVSREKLTGFIEQVKEKYKAAEVYLGGFSQGAIMSYTIGLTNPAAVTGILSFSGRILQQIRPLVKYGPALEQLKVFVAHGTEDGTLPVHYAREAKLYLEQAGVKLSYHEFETGHQLNDQIIAAMVNWLQA